MEFAFLAGYKLRLASGASCSPTLVFNVQTRVGAAFSVIAGVALLAEKAPNAIPFSTLLDY